jgi:ketosteroid isomerase-like protein
MNGPEWDSWLRAKPFRGREEILAGADDWLDAGENWRIAIDDVTEAGEDKALAFLRISIRGKGSGVPVEQRIYSLMTVRGSKISKIDDYTDRARALETAGLDKQQTR